MLVLAAVGTLTAAQAIQLIPVFAGQVFEVGAAGLGLLLAVVGAGKVAGSVFIGRDRGAARSSRQQRLVGVAYGVAVVAFALAPAFGVSLAFAALVGVAAAAFEVINGAIVVMHTDGAMYGRVTGLYQLTFSLAPIGAIPVAALADRPVRVSVFG